MRYRYVHRRFHQTVIIIVHNLANETVFLLQEINTQDDERVEFKDDKNQLIWFLQPQEAQFYLAAETLKHKPSIFVRTKLPFKPRISSKATRKWPEIQEIQEYLRKMRASEVGVEGEASIIGKYLTDSLDSFGLTKTIIS